MIREFVMRARHLEFRHVTRDAVFFGHFTHFGTRLSSSVTCPAARIITCIAAVQLDMRIVTSGASDALIIRVVTFAAREPVRLEANIRDPEHTRACDFFPGTMTLSAEIRRVFRGHGAKAFHRRILRAAGLYCSQVILC